MKKSYVWDHLFPHTCSLDEAERIIGDPIVEHIMRHYAGQPRKIFDGLHELQDYRAICFEQAMTS